MTCLVVGTDSLGSAATVLRNRLGVQTVIHWDGRKRPPRDLPRKVNLVVVYAGFVSHALMRMVRDQAKARDIKMVFVSRGLSELPDR
ncbi:MAG: DUF2325 domain-containing protein [Desulforudis sp.]|nr:MAG: DUF2325 domain-containing protein [Desulforudis sp.]